MVQLLIMSHVTPSRTLSASWSISTLLPPSWSAGRLEGCHTTSLARPLWCQDSHCLQHPLDIRAQAHSTVYRSTLNVLVLLTSPTPVGPLVRPGQRFSPHCPFCLFGIPLSLPQLVFTLEHPILLPAQCHFWHHLLLFFLWQLYWKLPSPLDSTS